MKPGEVLTQKILKDIQVEAADEFDRNFERKGFFEPGTWKHAKNNQRGSLMARSGKLRRSIRAEIKGNGVVFTSSQEYAAIHNEGGEIVVTEKMKKYFWAKYYEFGGGGSKRKNTNTQAEYYKMLALKKTGSKLTIPKRQFIGSHPELDKSVIAIIEQGLETFFKSNLITILKLK